MEHFEASDVRAELGKGNDDPHCEPDRSQLQEDVPPPNDDGSEAPDQERQGEINLTVLVI